MESFQDDYAMKMHILHAMEEQLADGSVAFDDVSITKLCESAGISRSTFYRYFSDKYEIAQWHFDFIASESLYQIGRTIAWFDGSLRNNLEHEKHRVFYIAAFKSRGYQSLFSYVKRAHIENLRDVIQNHRSCELDEELSFEIVFAAEGEAALVSQWACDGMKMSSIRLAELTCKCIPSHLYQVINEGMS